MSYRVVIRTMKETGKLAGGHSCGKWLCFGPLCCARVLQVAGEREAEAGYSDIGARTISDYMFLAPQCTGLIFRGLLQLAGGCAEKTGPRRRQRQGSEWEK